MKKTILTLLIASLSLGGLYAKDDYKNAKLSTEKRVASLLSQMTLEEKIAQMDMVASWDIKKYGDDASLNKLGVGAWIASVTSPDQYNEIQKLSEKSRLQIPFLVGVDAAHGHALMDRRTIFPTSISIAATFNPNLVYRISQVTAQEVRANGIQWTFAPSIDIVHDARWGRTGETYGECPFLSSVLVTEAVKGLQDSDNPNERIAACAKHLIGGGASVGGVNHGNAEISERMLRNYFLPPFKAAIDAGLYTIMPGHNDVNGIPAHSDKWLLDDVIRKEYGFDGFYITDMGDIENLSRIHRSAENQKDAIKQSISAGIDMHMFSSTTGEFITPLTELVKEGKISQERVDDAVAKILTVKFNLGLFENRYLDVKKYGKAYGKQESKDLALEAARESIILLKNSDNLLPLDKTKYKKILVTGPNANNQALLGDWTFTQPEDHITTILKGVKDHVGKDCEIVFSNSGKLKGKKSDVTVETTDPITQAQVLKEGGELNEFAIADAVEKAKSSDLAIVAVGGYGIRSDWGLRTYGESADRPSIDFYGMQEELIRRIEATGTPVIVVIVNGKPLNNPWVTNNIPTIVDIWEPGMYGGKALAEILFGDINPSGKLPITIPQTAGHVPQYYYQTQSRYTTGYGLGSTRADDKPAYAFGHGLSYTSFEYTNPVVNDSIMHAGKNVEVSVDVTNTGKVAGNETVFCFIRDEVSSVVTPLQLLKGFDKVLLQPGETKTVKMSIPFEEFGLWNREMKYVVEPGKFQLRIGAAADDIKHIVHLKY